MKNFEKELHKLFDECIDFGELKNDTIWHTSSETLFDAILALHLEAEK
jgi:hypothetical protein